MHYMKILKSINFIIYFKEIIFLKKDFIDIDLYDKRLNFKAYTKFMT